MEGQMVDSCKHSTKPLGSINCGKFWYYTPSKL
jgi:hypothetical protein